MKLVLTACLATVCCLASVPSWAQGGLGTVVAPNNLATEDQVFGAGDFRSPVRIQLAYGAVHFPTGALAITELRFRPDRFYGFAFTTTVANIDIRLSTTTKGPEGLNAVYAQNVGPDETVVVQGALTLSSQFTGPPAGPKDFDIAIPLATPFVYVPAYGNLLVDIRNFSGSGASYLSGQGRNDDSASRVGGAVNNASGSPDRAVDALQIVYYPTNAPPPPPPPPPRLARGPYLQSGTPTNLIVRWRTEQPLDSRVQFGLAATTLGWEVNQPGTRTEHILTLTNLAPDTKYFYAVGTSETNLVSGTNYYFITGPARPKPVRIWVLGDSGTAGQFGYAGMAAQVRDAYFAYTGARETDVWLMLGDNAYLSGTDEEYQTALFDIYPTQLRRSVLWPTIGNHDVNFNGFPYLQMFSLPTEGQAGGIASGTEAYYSFDYGNIHFVCLDSETSSRSAGSPMLTWLEADLTANTNDWLIAFWHRPPYSFGSHDSDIEGPMIEMRQNVMPILEAHGVDLVLTGHSHDYQRSYLLDGHYGYSYNLQPAMIKDSGSGQAEDTGPYRKAGVGPAPNQGAVQIVAGSSGWVTPDTPTIPMFQHPIMFIKLKRLGSLVIDVDGQRLDARFLRETGAIDDHFTILKGAAPEALRFATFRVRGGTLTARWKSVAGQIYHVERAVALDGRPDWQPVSPDITATGATTGWSNAVPPGLDKAFYRVVTLR